MIFYGALASQEANQDPIDLAFITSAKQRNLIDNSFVQKEFVPFDPQTRKTEAMVQRGNMQFRVMKGAVNIIAPACGLDESMIRELDEKISGFAMKGYRTLAVAKTTSQNQPPTLVGLVMLHDMPRPDSKQLIEKLKDLGISVKMLTGDALPIAKEIAKNVGLGENIAKISDLKGFIREDVLKAVELAEKSEGFAEIYPEDKYTIVKSLQSSKYVVGMTGDGVNDAPVLRQAEVGIAVSNATDVAKGAASVVLTSEGLTGIVNLIENGRIIYERISAWILSKIVRTLQIACLVVFPFFITGNYVTSAFDIILLFFMTDFMKLSLSTDNLRWSRKPNTWNISGLVRVATILGFLVIAESFGLLYIGLRYFHLAAEDQTLYTFTFEILFYFAMFLVFNVRERGHFWDSMPSKTLLTTMMLSMIFTTFLLTLGIPGLKAIPLTETFFVIFYSAVCSLVFNDLIKFILVKKTGVGW